jgi:hypothetical protein
MSSNKLTSDTGTSVNCDDKSKPKVGLLFDTLLEGRQFYENYAHSVGFSVCASSQTTDKNGTIRWKYFVCSKEGYLPDKKKDKEQSEVTVKTRRRSLTRELRYLAIGTLFV